LRRAAFDYLACRRHVLLDMHVPDWDERLLRDFDPVAMAALYRRAGAEAVMLYCNSHVGLCYWPTRVGAVHGGIGGRDLVGEAVRLAHEDGMAACAYYSLNFNNWAYHEHPDWRLAPAVPDVQFSAPTSKYGLCCPNNPGFHEFELEQVRELASGYDFDAFFFDMMFWPAVCVCDRCRSRWREEGGGEIPSVVDWFSPEWCAFQAARERWLAERFAELVKEVKSRLEIPVFLNAGMIQTGWIHGQSHALLDHNDLLGGDPTEPDDSALAYGLLLAGLTPTTLQFMYAFSGYIGGAGYLRSVEEQQLRYALPLAALGGQYMAIDAVEPNGGVNPAAYEVDLAQVFTAMEPYGELAPGRPVGDVSVYWSLPSQVDFAENGTPLSDPSFSALSQSPLPHGEAVLGVVEAARACLPVGVVTRKDLGRLGDCPLVVLPNVLRMDEEEVAAVREYVAGGGRVVASGYTSLVGTDGVRHDDFRLADVFGCHFDGIEEAGISYARPRDELLAESITPLTRVPFAGEPATIDPGGRRGTSIAVVADDDTEVLATLTRPYAEGRGTKGDRAWASIHATPPFEDTDQPVVVRHRFGKGEAVYLAGDLDARAAESAAARRLMLAILRSVLPEPSFEVDGDPGVWAIGHRLDGAGGLRLALLNYPGCLPARRSGRLRVAIAAPAGKRIARIARFPSGARVDFEPNGSGGADLELDGIDRIAVLEALFAEA
jgi:putative glycosyl hydrolase-like family 6 (GHL6) protein